MQITSQFQITFFLYLWFIFQLKTEVLMYTAAQKRVQQNFIRASIFICAALAFQQFIF